MKNKAELKFEQKAAIELPDEELDGVSGGWTPTFTIYNSASDVRFKWGVGASVERVYYIGTISGHLYTSGCTVVDRAPAPNTWGSKGGWVPTYFVTSSDSDYNNTWQPEFYFQGGYSDYSRW